MYAGPGSENAVNKCLFTILRDLPNASSSQLLASILVFTLNVSQGVSQQGYPQDSQVHKSLPSLTVPLSHIDVWMNINGKMHSNKLFWACPKYGPTKPKTHNYMGDNP